MSEHGRRRSGSAQSSKVVYAAVKDRRSVTAFLPGGTKISGAFVVGMDDYHWVLADEDGWTHLVHKSLAVLSVHPSPSTDSPVAAEPYRRWVMKNIYNHQADTATDEGELS